MQEKKDGESGVRAKKSVFLRTRLGLGRGGVVFKALLLGGVLSGLLPVLGGDKVCEGASFLAKEAVVSEKGTAPSFCQKVPSYFHFLSAQKEGDVVISSFKTMIIGQYQVGKVSPRGADLYKKGSSGWNDEFRRFYLGFHLGLFGDKWMIKNLTDVGGLPGVHKSGGGRWVETKTTWCFFEFFLERKTEEVEFVLGKFYPKLTAEYRTSSTCMPWVERSAVVNQLISISNWGVQLTQADKNAFWGWNSSVFLNGTGRQFSEEWEMNHKDSVSVLLSSSWATSSGQSLSKSRLWLDYVHNFSHYAGEVLPPDVCYGGPKARDIVTLSWSWDYKPYFFLAEAISGYKLVGHKAGKNVYGLSFTGTYLLEEQWELVSRLNLSCGTNSVMLNTRYVPLTTQYGSWVDRQVSVYGGVNYLLCPKDPAFTRLMMGVEFTSAMASKAAFKSYNGWSFLAALRFKF